MRLSLQRGPCARLVSRAPPLWAAAASPKRRVVSPVAALGPPEPADPSRPRILRPRIAPKPAGRPRTQPSAPPSPAPSPTPPAPRPGAPVGRPTTRPSPDDDEIGGPPAPGARCVGQLRVYLRPANGVAYLTGAATIRAAFPAAAARAVEQGLRSQPQGLLAEGRAGGGVRPHPGELYFNPGKGEWRISQVGGLIRELGAAAADNLEAWLLPDGRVLLRASELAAAGGQPATAGPGVPRRRVNAATRAAGPEPQAQAAQSGAGGGYRRLGPVTLTVNSKRYLAGAQALANAFPAAWEAAGATGENQEVTLLARSPAHGNTLLAYNLKLLGRQRFLSSVSALMNDLGLEAGDALELWRDPHDRVEARVVEA